MPPGADPNAVPFIAGDFDPTQSHLYHDDSEEPKDDKAPKPAP